MRVDLQAVVKLFHEGLFYREIGIKVGGVNARYVQQVLKKLGLGAKDRKKKPSYPKKVKICSFPNCGRPHDSKGFCSTHYRQLKKGESLHPVGWTKRTCQFANCDRPHYAHGFCAGHLRLVRLGLPLRPLKYYRKSA